MISMKRSVKVIAKAMIMMYCASVAAVSCDTYDDSEIWETIKELQEKMDAAADELQQVLYTIPNIPYDEVPEGTTAEENVIVKTGGGETPLPENALPHWELAKKYNLIDFDLGVKITGALGELKSAEEAAKRSVSANLDSKSAMTALASPLQTRYASPLSGSITLESRIPCHVLPW